MRVLAWLAISSLFAVGCRWVVSLDQLTNGDSSTSGEGGAGGASGIGGASTTAGAGGSSMGGGDAANNGKPSDAQGESLPKSPTPVRRTVETPGGIAVFGDNLYWVEVGPLGGVFRVPKLTASSGGDPIYNMNATDGPAFDVAADVNYVYWSNGTGNQVFRLGNAPGSLPEEYFPGARITRYIAVDDLGRVYVTEPASIAYGDPMSRLLFGMQLGVSGIAVDASNVYWGYRDVSGAGIRRWARGTASFSGLVGGESGRIEGIGTDSVNVYWINDNGEIKVIGKSPGEFPRVVCTGDFDAGADGDADVAVDDDWIYFTQPSQHQIAKCSKK